MTAEVIAYGDVRELTAATLRADLGHVPDIIVGSPPCQDASVANARGRGLNGARTGLFGELIRLVGECRPAWGVAENAPGLGARGLEQVVRGLEAEGYRVWCDGIGARDLGLEHDRERIWITLADPDRARLEIGQGERADACQEQSSVQRGGFPAGLLRRPVPPASELDDELARLVAERRGLYRAICAAQGDAVVPHIPYAIGRAMRRLYPDARTVLDLFSGAVCGWGLGMTWAGYDVVALCEIDDWRRSVALEVHRELHD